MEIKKHDVYVSKQLLKQNYDVFIGYETSSLNSFKTAKRQEKITILDLAQVHWRYIKHLRNTYPVFKSMQEDWVFDKVSAVKEEEFKYVDCIFALSTFAKKTLVDNGIEEKKIHVVNLGFDPSKFERKKIYDANPNRPLKLLFAGTITRRKGVHLVLEAVKQSENVQLTIVGPLADGQEYLDKYKGYYTHIPFLHHDELSKQYREADLFVFPSYLDSWAMVVLEAMASGTPVIVTENTGSKDAVIKGGGKIIPVDDIDALKSAIEYYNGNRDKLKKDGIEANRVAQDYTWDSYYNRINKILSDIKSENEI